MKEALRERFPGSRYSLFAASCQLSAGSGKREAELAVSCGEPLARGRDECREERIEFARAPEVLGVPLHADTERRFGRFNRFDHAVWCRRGGDEPASDSAHRLVMPAVDAAGRGGVHCRAERPLEAVTPATVTECAVALPC